MPYNALPLAYLPHRFLSVVCIFCSKKPHSLARCPLGRGVQGNVNWWEFCAFLVLQPEKTPFIFLYTYLEKKQFSCFFKLKKIIGI